MSPAAVVTGRSSGAIVPEHMPERGEVEEHGRAAWRNGIVNASDLVLAIERNSGNHTLIEIVTMLSRKLGMPESIALQLAEAAIKKAEGFAVECDTIFEEEGRIGGPRHYANYRVR